MTTVRVCDVPWLDLESIPECEAPKRIRKPKKVKEWTVRIYMVYHMEKGHIDQYYIGSTKCPLKKRLKEHRLSAIARRKSPLYRAMEKNPWTWKIKLVDSKKVQTKEEGLRFELDVLNSMKSTCSKQCLNRNRPIKINQNR